MANLYVCPFYKSEDPLTTRCEAGTLKYPSRSAMSWYRHQYCGSFDFAECTLAMMMNGYYEEMFEEDEKNGEHGDDKDAGLGAHDKG